MSNSTLIARALQLTQRIDLKGLDRLNQFSAGVQGRWRRHLFRFGAAILVGMNPEEEEDINGLDASLIDPLVKRETETVQIVLKADGEDQPIAMQAVLIYGEEAYGFAKTGQTICNVTDSKIIKLFVGDEPFWLPHANLVSYDRRLNMQSGTLDRDIPWKTPEGKQVSITSPLDVRPVLFLRQ